MNEALTDLANEGVHYNLRSRNEVFIHQMHKWWPKKYSFAYVLHVIRLTSLALKQHFICILYMQTRLVSLIST